MQLFPPGGLALTRPPSAAIPPAFVGPRLDHWSATVYTRGAFLTPACAVVVTTINPPTRAVTDILEGATKMGAGFYVIGDSKSPADFRLPGAHYLDLEAQRRTGFTFAELCPTRHYARKNVGYLAAIRDGASVIIETDDDNIPRPGFWAERTRTQTAPLVEQAGWCNVYAYYAEGRIWPRGLPLDQVTVDPPAWAGLKPAQSDCPIQQGLADENPDVDAIYRLILPLPVNFAPDRDRGAGQGRLVSLQQPEHHLLEGRLPAALSALPLLVPDDRHLEELRRPADPVGERLAAAVPQLHRLPGAQRSRPHARLRRRGAGLSQQRAASAARWRTCP